MSRSKSAETPVLASSVHTAAYDNISSAGLQAEAIFGHHESYEGSWVINYSSHSVVIEVGSILTRARSVIDNKYARKPCGHQCVNLPQTT